MFSVVVPVFQARRTLARTVRSVLDQTVAELELVLVDDGSTDGAIETVPDDPRIVVVRQEHAGEGPARNRGVATASHPWIAFLDADDLWLPGHLAELGRLRRRFPQARLLGTRALDSDFAGRFAPPDDDEDAAAELELIPFFARMALEPRPMIMSSSALERAVLDDVGPFAPLATNADLELLARVALRHPVAVSSRVTAVYVHGTGGVSERTQRRYVGRDIRSARDLAPAVARLLEHCDGLPPAEHPPGTDAFVDRYVGWCLRTSAYIGDVATIRRLRPLYRGRPPVEDRVLLLAGRLPGPVARAAGRPVSRAARLVARAVRRLRGAAARGSSPPARDRP